ncbi:hypothetical protein QUF70_01245 [Desulfobacterales bacterium HSG17]|nr:hypothetical protein [Desulfobacterales bacterium HSG17]
MKTNKCIYFQILVLTTIIILFSINAFGAVAGDIDNSKGVDLKDAEKILLKS